MSTLFSDNAGEYASGMFTSMLREEGVQHKTSAPYVSEDNGLAERQMRQLADLARCMMAFAKTPKFLWNYAMEHACYVLNRMPMKILGGISPFEAKYKRKPDLTGMRIFGSPVYVHEEAPVGKFSNRAHKGVYIGFNEKNGCFMVMTGGRWLSMSKSVVFNEMALLGKKEEATVNEDESEQYFVIEEDVPSVVKTIPAECVIESDAIDRHDVPADEMPPPLEQAEEIVPAVKVEVEEKKSQQEVDAEQTSAHILQLEESKSADDHVDNPQLGSIVGASDEASNREATSPVEEEKSGIASRRRNPVRQATLKNPYVSSTAMIDAMADIHKKSSVQRHVHVTETELSNDEMVCIAATTGERDLPNTYDEAMTSAEKDQWKTAVNEELEAHRINGTWEVVDRQQGMSVIDAKWVFARKYDAEGRLVKHKARLVARGFKQKGQFDYHEVFAPVVRYGSIRVLLDIAIEKNWMIEQSDVSNAFLNGVLDSPVYMAAPPSVIVPAGKVCALKKGLYGLRQAPKVWNSTIHQFLVSIGFQQSKVDGCMYSINKHGHQLILALYVDDMLYASDNKLLVQEVKDALATRFKIKHMGSAAFILGMKIERTEEGIKLSQEQLVKRLLSDHGMSDCNPVKAPLAQDAKVNAHAWTDVSAYRSIVGTVRFLESCTRPDISFAANYLSRRMEGPCVQDWEAAKHVLRYLKGTAGVGIVYKKGKSKLVGHSDATWAVTSILGYYFARNGPISWSSKVQKSAALNSTESELQAASSAAQEAIYLMHLYESLGVKVAPVMLLIDNMSTQQVIERPKYSARLKHIVLREEFITERVEKGEIVLQHVSGVTNLADAMTKPLSGPRHSQFASQMVQ